MSWSVNKSRKLYGFSHWAESYFDCNEAGHLVAKKLQAESDIEVDLYSLAQSLNRQGYEFPILLRFLDILNDRVDRLQAEFERARCHCRYQGSYRPVYPIKVNQQYTVVKQLISMSYQGVGLESGSKPELIACLSMLETTIGLDAKTGLDTTDLARLASNQSLIICNGYKDREYIRLALMATLLGHEVIIVVEKPSEIILIQEECEQLQVKPKLGVRVRLQTKGEGNWQNTGGEKSKFGFSATGLLDLVNQLKKNNLLDSLGMLHFHMGSQISNIEFFSQAVDEAMQYYVQLQQLGAKLSVLDVGGGLAVDYEASQSKSFFSMNYNVAEYADVLVETIQKNCKYHGINEPDVISEAGRAMTAHHGVLITNVVDQEKRPEFSAGMQVSPQSNDNKSKSLLQLLVSILDTINGSNYPELLVDAKNIYESSFLQKQNRSFSLQQKSELEIVYYQICRHCLNQIKTNSNEQRDIKTIKELSELLADKYFCNMSIFQSIPDVWGLNQVFPIVPLHKLECEPDKRVIIKDLTCDSDGRIDNYTEQNGLKNTLRLHRFAPKEEYLLGFFLVGAYQEILGDMHNLFGDTHAVDIKLDDQGKVRVVGIEQGDSVGEVLSLVHYDTAKIMQSIEQQIKMSNLDNIMKDKIREQVTLSLKNYTYFNS